MADDDLDIPQDYQNQLAEKLQKDKKLSADHAKAIVQEYAALFEHSNTDPETAPLRKKLKESIQSSKAELRHGLVEKLKGDFVNTDAFKDFVRDNVPGDENAGDAAIRAFIGIHAKDAKSPLHEKAKKAQAEFEALEVKINTPGLMAKRQMNAMLKIASAEDEMFDANALGASMQNTMASVGGSMMSSVLEGGGAPSFGSIFKGLAMSFIGNLTWVKQNGKALMGAFGSLVRGEGFKFGEAMDSVRSQDVHANVFKTIGLDEANMANATTLIEQKVIARRAALQSGAETSAVGATPNPAEEPPSGYGTASTKKEDLAAALKNGPGNQPVGYSGAPATFGMAVNQLQPTSRNV